MRLSSESSAPQSDGEEENDKKIQRNYQSVRYYKVQQLICLTWLEHQPEATAYMSVLCLHMIIEKYRICTNKNYREQNFDGLSAIATVMHERVE